MRRIAVAMQKEDRDRFDLLALENVGERVEFGQTLLETVRDSYD